jgi:hypothetical protein
MGRVTAPDLAVAVVGYRAWRIAGERLMSPFVPCRWEDRVMHAECYDANRSLLRGEGWLREPHASPHADCKCGIYAYHRPGLRTWFGEVFWCEGLITAWGRLEVHADGFRAAHARVEALARPGRDEYALAEQVTAIGRRLGVPVVGRDELPALAERVGAPLPASLLPG